MKLNGKVIDQPNEVLVVIPRPTGDLAFKLKAVLEFEEFDAICPRPKPPTKTKGTVVIEDVEDKSFQDLLEKWAQLRVQWSVLKSFEGSDIEWDTIDMKDSSTWINYESELRKAQFSDVEINLLVSASFEANSLNQEIIDEAKARFLALESAAQ